MLGRNGVNSIAPARPRHFDRTCPLRFSERSLKHIVPVPSAIHLVSNPFCQQPMAENPVPVCAAADVPVNGVISREVGDELVAIYNIDGVFYATEARCTHGLADLADGTLDGDVIECSFHFGAFHVPSGKAVQPPCFINIKTYKTEVKDGQVLVDLGTPAPTAG
jgi:nitrite reductase/ring-hydroxylating ferredoxin subunit